MPEVQPTCETCRFWHEIMTARNTADGAGRERVGTGRGLCFRMPPSAFPGVGLAILSLLLFQPFR